MKKKFTDLYTLYDTHHLAWSGWRGPQIKEPIRIGKYNIIIPFTWIYSCSALEDLDFLISYHKKKQYIDIPWHYITYKHKCGNEIRIYLSQKKEF